MIAVGDNSETELLLLQPGLRTVPEVIMDTTASLSATSSNSPFSCLDQQPQKTRNSRKKKGPKRVSGQKKIKHTGPSVSGRSSVVAGRKSKWLSARSLEKTANTAPRKSGSMNLRLEAGDISMDDIEFRRSAISVFKQFCKSISTAKELNNPVNDRSEFVERVRSQAYDLFRGTGCVMVAALILVPAYAFLNQLRDHGETHFPEHEMMKNATPAVAVYWFFVFGFMLAQLYLAGPPISFLSFAPTALVTAAVDTYEKKITSGSDDSAAERFLKKYNRMESLHHRLKKLRLSYLVIRPRECPLCESPMSKVGVRSGRVGGKPEKNVNLKEKSKHEWIDHNDISFYLAPEEINWKNLETAIAETEEWLNSAEKQMQLIRNHSSDTLLLIDNEKLKLTPV